MNAYIRQGGGKMLNNKSVMDLPSEIFGVRVKEKGSNFNYEYWMLNKINLNDEVFALKELDQAEIKCYLEQDIILEEATKLIDCERINQWLFNTNENLAWLES